MKKAKLQLKKLYASRKYFIISIVMCSFVIAAIVYASNVWDDTAPKQVDTGNSQSATIEAVDLTLDGDTADGYIDLITVSDVIDDTKWYKSDGTMLDEATPALDFTEYIIDGSNGGSFNARTSDIDSDGDLDIVIASFDLSDISYYLNDGNSCWTNSGVNCTKHQIDANCVNAYNVDSGDFDNDGDIDVVGICLTGDVIRWYENDGSENFTTHDLTSTVFASRWDVPVDVSVADIDEDGDDDIVASCASCGGDATLTRMAWFENNGTTSLAERTIQTNTHISWLSVGDLDNDGDPDILGSYSGTTVGILYYWESDGIMGDESTYADDWTRHTVRADSGGDFLTPRRTVIANFNGDNLNDIAVAVYTSDKNLYFQNQGGCAVGGCNFDEEVIDDTASVVNSAWGIAAGDIDGDGFLDVAGTGHQGLVNWWENQLTEFDPPIIPEFASMMIKIFTGLFAVALVFAGVVFLKKKTKGNKKR